MFHLMTQKARASKVTSWRDSTHMAACSSSKLDILIWELNSASAENSLFKYSGGYTIAWVSLPTSLRAESTTLSLPDIPERGWSISSPPTPLTPQTCTGTAGRNWRQAGTSCTPWSQVPHSQAARQTASQGGRTAWPSRPARRTALCSPAQEVMVHSGKASYPAASATQDPLQFPMLEESTNIS